MPVTEKPSQTELLYECMYISTQHLIFYLLCSLRMHFFLFICRYSPVRRASEGSKAQFQGPLQECQYLQKVSALQRSKMNSRANHMCHFSTIASLRLSSSAPTTYYPRRLFSTHSHPQTQNTENVEHFETRRYYLMSCKSQRGESRLRTYSQYVQLLHIHMHSCAQACLVICQ